MHSKALNCIFRIERCFQTYRRQQLQDTDTTPMQQLLISSICRHPGKSQDGYAEALCLDKTTVAHHLVKLEKNGYVDRQVSPEDSRVRLVYPTQAALELYPRIHESYETFTSALLVGLTEADQQELTRLAEILFRNAVGLIHTQGGRRP